jgi:hypothetical protein
VVLVHGSGMYVHTQLEQASGKTCLSMPETSEQRPTHVCSCWPPHAQLAPCCLCAVCCTHPAAAAAAVLLLLPLPVPRHLRNQLSQSIVHELVAEAVELEREFICEALQVGAGHTRARVWVSFLPPITREQQLVLLYVCVCAGVETSQLGLLCTSRGVRQAAASRHSQRCCRHAPARPASVQYHSRGPCSQPRHISPLWALRTAVHRNAVLAQLALTHCCRLWSYSCCCRLLWWV